MQQFKGRGIDWRSQVQTRNFNKFGFIAFVESSHLFDEVPESMRE